jgi:hypothetical protein
MKFGFYVLGLAIACMQSISFAGPTIYDAEKNGNDVQILSAVIDTQNAIDQQTYCHNITLKIVAKQSVMNSPVLSGIGFYSNFAIEGSRSPLFSMLPGSNPFNATPATLKTGEAAEIYTFHAVGYCWEGDMSSSMYQELSFKAYAQYGYHDANGDYHIAKVWSPGDNAWLGGHTNRTTWQLQHQTSFDLSGDVLR